MKFEEVVKVVEKTHREMHEQCMKFNWESRDNYTSWMAQSNEYVVYAPRILALTGGHFPLEKTALAMRFIQHASEEKGHEKLLINDAKQMGLELSKIPVLPEAEAFHKSLYFWIHHSRPGVIMGWILLLEGLAVKSGPAIYERVVKAHGTKPASFLKVHTQEDPDHVEKALEALKVFTDAELSDVVHGLELYAKLYANVYQAISARHQDQSKHAAA